MNKNKYWKFIKEKSKSLVSLYDLCGHEKYLKTTIHGLVSLSPDYSLIVVGANMGISKMTREHIGISLFLKIPFIVVMTKTDIAPENVYKQNLSQIKSLVRHPLVDKQFISMTSKTNDSEISQWADQMHGNQITPIFSVSNVTGEGIPQLIKFIKQIKNRSQYQTAFKTKDGSFEYDIHETFLVPGVGIVVSGLVKSGQVTVGTVV